MPEQSLHVVHFQRRPHPGYYSVERVFAAVRDHIPPGISCRVALSRFESHGLFSRLYMVAEAAFRQGEVNHITGDVHFIAFSMKKRRTILTIHDCNLIRRSHGIKRWVYRWLWYALPAKRSACVTVISEEVKRELLSYISIPPEQVHIIYDPVPDEFQANPKAFDTEKPVFLQIGTGDNKNLSRVAEALAGTPCHLRIVGNVTPAHKAVLAEHDVAYSSVSGISDEQIVQEYRNCDLLIFVSTYEGFGMPIVEANATGRPVVSSAIPPMTEVAGAAACLVDPLDVAAIREGIQRVLADASYRDELVRRGYDNAARFRASAIAAEYTRLYKNVAAAAKGTP